MKKILALMILGMSKIASADSASAVITGYLDIVGDCTLNSNLYFDFKNVVKADRSTQRKVGSLNVVCPNTVNYSVYRLQNSELTTNNVSHLFLNMYTDSSYTNLLNNTNKLNFVGTGSAQVINVYGELSLAPNFYSSLMGWGGSLHDDTPQGMNGGLFSTYTLNSDVIIEF